MSDGEGASGRGDVGTLVDVDAFGPSADDGSEGGGPPFSRVSALLTTADFTSVSSRADICSTIGAVLVGSSIELSGSATSTVKFDLLGASASTTFGLDANLLP